MNLLGRETGADEDTITPTPPDDAMVTAPGAPAPTEEPDTPTKVPAELWKIPGVTQEFPSVVGVAFDVTTILLTDAAPLAESLATSLVEAVTTAETPPVRLDTLPTVSTRGSRIAVIAP
jgi:hypothetical protein